MGNIFYEQGDYIASEKKYKEALEANSESDIVNFNLGTVLYKKGQYQEAIDHFQKVFLSEDDQLKHKAYYNSGNALYKIGMAEEKEGITALAIPPVELSIKQYERALEIDENDEDTKHNYAFVQQELIRLQEKQQQEQKQEGQGQDSEKSQGQQQQQDQQSQNDQSQDGQQQQESDGQENTQGQQGEQQDSDQGQDQENAQGSEEEDNSQQKSGGQAQSASKLTPREAQRLLEGYQQTEEPQHLLNMQPKVNYSTPVFKDW